MVDIVTRAGKGSPLTNNEVDANFTNLAEVSGITGEPMGHEDRTTSTISFNASTRTFTIAPVSTSFTVWCKGKKVVVSSAQTVTIPNTSGMYSIYFDANGALAAKAGYFTFSEEAPTAYIYWNAATGACPYFGDERHGVVLDWQTHEYLHRTRGAALASGFGASGYTLGGNGTSNAHAQLTLEGGTFFDEDMKIIVTATNTPTAGTWEQDLLSPARIPVLYLSGTGWVIDAPTDYPLKQGTARPQYNALSGGVWSTADVANNKYATSWILATNNLTYPVIAIIGQAESDLQSAAEAVDFTSLQLPGFPSVEFRPLYRLVFQCADSFSNAVKASLVSITDIRSIAAAGVAASLITDHGNLSGLSDDDHPQYLSVDTVRASLTAAVKASFLPSQTGNAGKFLTTDATSTSWTALTSGNITTALGFTPYNATNPAGYITGITSSDVTTALGFTPYNATNPSGYITTAGARGAISVTGAGSYDSATGVINIVGGVTSFNTRTGAITLSSADVTTALGFTPYNSTNPNGYLTGITSTQVTTALGYTPYNSSNPSGYISGITSGMVTTALGYTPYNSSNPSGYITSSALSGYLTSASAASTYLPLSGGSLSGPLTITGNGTYVGNYGYSTLILQDSSGYPGLNYRSGSSNWLIRMNAGGGSMTWAYSSNASAQATGAYTQYLFLDTAELNHASSIRAPIFYDLNDTGTYINPNGSSIINSGSGYPMEFRSSQRYIARFWNQSAAGYGFWLANDANQLTIHADSVGDVASVNSSGVFYTSNSFRAPIFYDSNDTSYYIDPNSTTAALLAGSIGVGTTSPVNSAWGTASSTKQITVYGSAYGVVNIRGDSTTATHYSMGVGDGRFYAAYDNVAAIHRLVFFGSFTGLNYGSSPAYNLHLGGTGLATDDWRAPIFYDSNNTAYYGDFASSSWGVYSAGGGRFRNIQISDSSYTDTIQHVTSGNQIWLQYSHSGNVGLVYGGGSVSIGNIASPSFPLHVKKNANQVAGFESPNANTWVDIISTTRTWSIGSTASASFAIYDRVSNGTRAEVDSSSNFYAYGSSRAPIFYDSNNTAYYGDFASTSQFNEATFAGYIGVGGGAPSANMSGTFGVSIYHANYPSVGFATAAGPNYLIYRLGNTGPLTVWNASTSETAYFYTGYTQFTGSARAPIFYDSNDTSYYVDPNSSSISAVFAGPVVAVGGLQSATSGYTSPYNIFTLSNTYNGGTYYGIKYVEGNPDVIQIIGNNNVGLSIGMDIGDTTASSSLRAPIFYDSNNTAYYVDPNGTSALTTAIFYVNGSSEITLTSAGTNASMIKAGSGDELYIGGNNTWQMRFSGANVLMDNGGYLLNGESIRSPIFYDSNNTNYYLDPTSNSVLNYVNYQAATGGSNANGTVAIKIAGFSNYDSLELGVQSNYSGFLRTYGNDLHYYSGHWRTAGTAASEDHQHYWYTSKAGSANWSTWKMQLNHNADFLVTGSVRAPIFYDYDNTAYYVDPSNISQLWGLTLAGGSYFRPNNWIQCDTSAGIYWPNHYGAHFYPNGSSTYTQLQIDGSKNSYSGMYISHSAVNGMMYDGGGNGGVYREANGKWYFYYLVSNDCMGIGTSSTNAAYGVYCNKGAYFGDRVDGTIFYDANNTGYYLDPTSVSSIRTVGSWRADSASWDGEFSGKMQYHASNWYLQFASNMIFRRSDGTNVMTCDSGGNVTFTGNVTAYSDARIKENVVTIDSALDKVLKLRGVYYNKIGNPERRVGVIAQEVKPVLPEVVRLISDTNPTTGETTELLAVDYGNIAGLLIEAIKEQDTELVDLRNRVAQLESLINKLIGD